MRVTVSNDGEIYICFENLDKSSDKKIPYNIHSCSELIKIINKLDDKTTLTHGKKDEYIQDCELIGKSIDNFTTFLNKINTTVEEMNNANNLSKQLVLIKEIIHQTKTNINIKGGKKHRRSKRILHKNKRSKKLQQKKYKRREDTYSLEVTYLLKNYRNV